MYFFHWRIQRRITKRSQRDGKPFTVLLISTFCWIAHILHNISLYSVSSKIAKKEYSPIHHLCCSEAAGVVQQIAADSFYPVFLFLSVGDMRVQFYKKFPVLFSSGARRSLSRSIPTGRPLFWIRCPPDRNRN